MDAKDILNYTERFKTKAPGGSVEYNDSIYYNDSVLHASIIMAELMKKALLEPDRTLNMYCGTFSLFRDAARNAILNKKLEYSPASLSADEQKEWTQFDPYAALQEQLAAFINDENKGRLNLIIERDLEGLKNAPVWRALKNGMEQGRVKVYTLRSPMGIGHFATTAEAYRLENSDGYKTAIGCFKDAANARILNDNFDFLKDCSDIVEA